MTARNRPFFYYAVIAFILVSLTFNLMTAIYQRRERRSLRQAITTQTQTISTQSTLINKIPQLVEQAYQKGLRDGKALAERNSTFNQGE